MSDRCPQLDHAAESGVPSPRQASELSQRALTGVLWSLLQSWGARAVTTVLFVVLARLLGAKVIGLAAYATLFVELGRVLVDQGFSQTVVQRAELDDLDVSTAFWTAIALGAGLSAASYLGAPTVAELLDRPDLAPILQWLAPSFLFASIGSTHLGLLQRHLRFRALAVQRLVAAGAGGAVAIVMAIGGHGVWSLVGMQLVTTSVGSVIAVVAGGRLPVLRFSWERLGELRSFGLSVMGLQLLDFLQANGDNFIIAVTLGDVVLGYYVLAYRIFTVTLEVLGTAVVSVAFPTFSRLTHDRVRLRRAYLIASRMTGTIAFPVFVGIAVTSNDIVDVLFGHRYAPAAPMMRLLALIGLTFIAGWFLRSLLLALGRARLQLMFSLTFTVVRLGVFAAFTSRGVNVALTGQLLASVLFLPFDAYTLRQAGIRLRDHLAVFVGPALASGVMAAAVLTWEHVIANGETPALALATSAVVGIAVYTTVLAAIDRHSLKTLRDNGRLMLGRNRNSTLPV